jgi:hypothetical protein
MEAVVDGPGTGLRGEGIIVTPRLKPRGSPGVRPRRKGPKPLHLEKGPKPLCLSLEGGKNQSCTKPIPNIRVGLPSLPDHRA